MSSLSSSHGAKNVVSEDEAENSSVSSISTAVDSIQDRENAIKTLKDLMSNSSEKKIRIILKRSTQFNF